MFFVAGSAWSTLGNFHVISFAVAGLCVGMACDGFESVAFCFCMCSKGCAAPFQAERVFVEALLFTCNFGKAHGCFFLKVTVGMAR